MVSRLFRLDPFDGTSQPPKLKIKDFLVNGQIWTSYADHADWIFARKNWS